LTPSDRVIEDSLALLLGALKIRLETEGGARETAP